MSPSAQAEVQSSAITAGDPPMGQRPVLIVTGHMCGASNHRSKQFDSGIYYHQAAVVYMFEFVVKLMVLQLNLKGKI